MTDEEARLMAAIGVGSVVRFRSAERHGDMICVCARIGGGNAECDTWPGQTCEEAGCYHLETERLRALPNFVSWKDDGGDSTYRYFLFRPLGESRP